MGVFGLHRRPAGVAREALRSERRRADRGLGRLRFHATDATPLGGRSFGAPSASTPCASGVGLPGRPSGRPRGARSRRGPRGRSPGIGTPSPLRRDGRRSRGSPPTMAPPRERAELQGARTHRGRGDCDEASELLPHEGRGDGRERGAHVPSVLAVALHVERVVPAHNLVQLRAPPQAPDGRSDEIR